MRATSMRRLVGGAASLLLICTMLLTTAGVATAGETRNLDIGSPGATTAYTLTFTKVGPSGVTKTDIAISNNGKQNLTKAHLYIGLSGSASLPTGVTIADVFGQQGAGTCTWTSGGTTLDCDFGSLTAKGPGKTRQVSVAFNVGATTPTAAIAATIKVAENVQDVGSNLNFRTATGTPVVDGASCHEYTTYVVRIHGPLDLAPTSADCTGESQQSALHIPEDAGNGLATYNDLTAAVCTVGQLTCFGYEVNATVANGAQISPYLVWTITYSAELMGNTNPTKVSFQHGTTLITFKKNTCGADFDGNDCVVANPVVDSAGAVTYTLWTQTNSVMKGLH